MLRTEKDTSFSDLANNEKLEMAKELLLTSDMTVVQIAETLNYSNVAEFHPIFQQKVRHDPRQIPQGLPEREEVREISLTDSKDRTRCVSGAVFCGLFGFYAQDVDLIIVLGAGAGDVGDQGVDLHDQRALGGQIGLARPSGFPCRQPAGG